MQTRNQGVYAKGFYNKKINLKKSQIKYKKTKSKRNIKSKTNNNSKSNNIKDIKDQSFLNTFKNCLKCFIIKSLRHYKNGPFKFLKFEINDSLKTYLVNKYKLNQRYKICPRIIDDFNLITKTFIDKKSSYELNLFQIKLNKKKFIAFKNESLQQLTYQSNSSISVRIQVISHMILDQDEIDFLENF